jgi:hypothetical protein
LYLQIEWPAISIDENIAPVSAPAASVRGIEMKFHPGLKVSARPGVPVGVTFGVMGVVAVVTGDVGGQVVWVGVGVIVVVVVVGVVVGIVVVGSVVGIVVVGVVVGTVVWVGVGVTPPNERVRFWADPELYGAVCPAGTLPFSQNVMSTWPPVISSTVGYTLSFGSNGPGPP